MSRERSALRTERCENSTSGMEHSHRGMVGGVFPPSSRVELDAKREPKRSALSFASWASELSSLCRDGSDGLQKFPWTALARDQNARVPEGRRTSFSPILPMCSYFALAITLEGPGGEVILLFKCAGVYIPSRRSRSPGLITLLLIA
ncbi:unnamed protein product [Parnassius mnemosyne]|uniref:Uncharacterized protein n=1 Tax=Parnassius mnemosyne TaxID=213953 RepID=A0AAV1KE37_9NEOP